MLDVVVIKGGLAFERSVSLRSGARAQEGLKRLGYRVSAVDLGPNLIDQLTELKPDVAFLALHGPGGEDGSVQEILQSVGVPYTGSKPAACIRCSDKSLTKYALVDAEIPTPDFFAFTEDAFNQLGAADALERIGQQLGFPVIVKPASQGSGLGLKLAADVTQLTAALLSAFAYDSKVVIERFVDGRDLAVSVLEIEGKATVLPIVEPISDSTGVLDFAGRYEIGKVHFSCPAELNRSVQQRASELALAVFETLGCNGFARVDMLYQESTDLLTVLELDTIPGLTENSLFPQAAQAAGIGFDRLLDLMLQSAKD